LQNVDGHQINLISCQENQINIILNKIKGQQILQPNKPFSFCNLLLTIYLFFGCNRMGSTQPMMVFDGNFLAEGDRVVQGHFFFFFNVRILVLKLSTIKLF
jgi:hypothetical protein